MALRSRRGASREVLASLTPEDGVLAPQGRGHLWVWWGQSRCRLSSTQDPYRHSASRRIAVLRELSGGAPCPKSPCFMRQLSACPRADVAAANFSPAPSRRAPLEKRLQVPSACRNSVARASRSWSPAPRPQEPVGRGHGGQLRRPCSGLPARRHLGSLHSRQALGQGYCDGHRTTLTCPVALASALDVGASPATRSCQSRAMGPARARVSPAQVGAEPALPGSEVAA